MIKTWLVRPKPHNIPRMREFLEEKIVAIGWPEIGSFLGKTEDQIKTALKSHPKNYSPDQLGAATSTVNSFVNEIRINDIAVVPDGNDIYFCRITSDYFYNPEKSSLSIGYPHQREAVWIKGPVRRDDIPSALRQSLRAPRTLADLSHHATAILDFIGEATADSAELPYQDDDLVSFTYPVRLNKTAIINIPKDITQTEAARLSEFVKTLYFE